MANTLERNIGTMEPQENMEASYPFVVFEAANSQFCINSRHVLSIMQLPEYEVIPESPAEVTGLFNLRGENVTLLNLRRMLGKKPMEEEYREFCDMIDARKQDHIRWVNELERSALAGEDFTLATDAHECALGKWYYSFHCDYLEVNFHLRKIEEPHNRLHHAAIEVAECARDCENCRRDECLKQILTRVRHECMPIILELLEETKEIFHQKVYHEMVLVLDGENKIGLVVDDVLSVEELHSVKETEQRKAVFPTRCIRDVKMSGKNSVMILELDIAGLISSRNISLEQNRECLLT